MGHCQPYLCNSIEAISEADTPLWPIPTLLSHKSIAAMVLVESNAPVTNGQEGHPLSINGVSKDLPDDLKTSLMLNKEAIVLIKHVASGGYGNIYLGQLRRSPSGRRRKVCVKVSRLRDNYVRRRS